MWASPGWFVGAECLCINDHRATLYLPSRQEAEKALKGPRNPRRMVGYHPNSKIPIKRGDRVTIQKGVVIRNTKRGVYVCGRTHKAEVDHILNGSSRTDWKTGEQSPTSNPSVRWPGVGGYWSEVDINDIPEAIEKLAHPEGLE